MSSQDAYEVSLLLESAARAFSQGNRLDARRWAVRAAHLAPKNEEAWLLLAAVASPLASVEYMQKALDVNPSSTRAKQGLDWAQHRVDSQLSLHAVRSTPRNLLIEKTPIRVHKSGYPPSHSYLPWLVGFALILAGMMFFVGGLGVWTVFARSFSAPRQVGLLMKPTLTPTPTFTYTPTATFTPTPTFTFTPTNTPTSTPSPTHTPPPPTSTNIPPAPSSGTSLDGRWIDIDLSEQMVYAYENNSLVNSFLVSTGTSAHPTVTGEFAIYVKYRYSDMSGPGYYLPGVPYTMYFYKGYGLHGTYWHSNFGTPMSHGCVNLKTEDAGWLYNWASIGTIVNIHP
jgi:lipoprotein-anchoring transpeptidase ErfK/SrfK